MNKKDTRVKTKTEDDWTTKVDEIFIKNGLTPNYLHKTGSVIMRAPRRVKSIMQQQNS